MDNVPVQTAESFKGAVSTNPSDAVFIIILADYLSPEFIVDVKAVVKLPLANIAGH
jgi:hypothetical protein